MFVWGPDTSQSISNNGKNKLKRDDIKTCEMVGRVVQFLNVSYTNLPVVCRRLSIDTNFTGMTCQNDVKFDALWSICIVGWVFHLFFCRVSFVENKRSCVQSSLVTISLVNQSDWIKLQLNLVSRSNTLHINSCYQILGLVHFSNDMNDCHTLRYEHIEYV